MTRRAISGLILAGGEGKRVGCKDKGWLDYQGMPLIEHQIDWLKPQVENIIISANRNIEAYQAFGYPVISDQQAGFHGPLQGILAALKLSAMPLWVQPVDMPDLPSDLIQKVEKVWEDSSKAGYLATNQRRHYLSMLIDPLCVVELEKFIAQGKARVSEFHSLIDSQVIQLAIDEEKFKNLNLSKDYKGADR